MEEEPQIHTEEGERLSALADELDLLCREKFGEEGHRVMKKLIDFLRSGNAEAAKILISNEADKFSDFREDGLPRIISELYGGSGSPWFTLERKPKR